MNKTMDQRNEIAVVIGQLAQGGTERQLYSFLDHCDLRAWSPTVYVSRGPMGFWVEPIRNLGVPIVLLEGGRPARMWAFRRACQAHRTRTFFSWSAHTNVYSLALWGMDVHCVGSYRNSYSSIITDRLRSWAYQARVSVIVCNSQETADAVRHRSRGRKRVVYVPNSVQPPADRQRCREEWRRHLGLHRDQVLVLGVGRLDPAKRFDRFLETVALVRQSIPVQAAIAGRNDGCLESLQERAAALGLKPGDVRFLGPVSEARELMCAADVFLLTSDFEGMPNVVLEAMAVGVPCVCTRVNGVSDLITSGVNGFITDRRADALAERVAALAGDVELRAETGKRARERVDGSFSTHQIAARLWQLCEPVPSSRQGRAAPAQL